MTAGRGADIVAAAAAAADGPAALVIVAGCRKRLGGKRSGVARQGECGVGGTTTSNDIFKRSANLSTGEGVNLHTQQAKGEKEESSTATRRKESKTHTYTHVYASSERAKRCQTF